MKPAKQNDPSGFVNQEDDSLNWMSARRTSVPGKLTVKMGVTSAERMSIDSAIVAE
jgi:hypothetical protein